MGLAGNVLVIKLLFSRMYKVTDALDWSKPDFSDLVLGWL